MGGARKRLTLEEFIFRSNNIHISKYDYSKSIYKNINSNIIVSCPIHGDFYQSPKAHPFPMKEYEKGLTIWKTSS